MTEEYTTENQETAMTIFESSTFMDIAMKPVTDEQAQILLEEINPDDLDILPTGEVYLTQAKYRAKLNKTFKPGGWAMRPISRPYIKDDLAMQEWALYANGQFMAYTVGGAEYKESNQRMNWSDVLETVKSNALMRLCKDLGIASECWNRRFTDHFKTEYCIKVWVDGKNKPQWRRLDSEPFYKETGVAQDSPNGYPIEQRRTTTSKATEQPKAQTIKPTSETPQKPLQQATEADYKPHWAINDEGRNKAMETLQKRGIPLFTLFQAFSVKSWDDLLNIPHSANGKKALGDAINMWNKASDELKFYIMVQDDTGGYYDHPNHLWNTVGNYLPADPEAQHAAAVDHARMRRAEKQNAEPAEEIAF